MATNVTFTYAAPAAAGSNTFLWSNASNLPLVSPQSSNSVTVNADPGNAAAVAVDDLGNATIFQMVVNAGATVEIAQPETLSVGTSVKGAGTVALIGSGAAIDVISGAYGGLSTALSFDGVARTIGHGEELILAGMAGGTDASAVTGFAAGDEIKLGAFSTITSAVVSGGTLSVTGTAGSGSETFYFTNFGTVVGTNIAFSGNVVEATCYAAGTRLLTQTGERAVEDLREGDLILTQQGDTLVPTPITWVGQLRIDLARHPRPEAAAPIRIRRGAFADGVPHRDLLVSPEHCLFADGQLIAAKSLVNGATIVQDFTVPAIQYFHIETTPHAIVLAEGLPAETYLDTGNRAMFDNAGHALLLHPEFHINTALRGWDTDACAPLATTAEQIAPVWHRLAARAQSLGHTLPQPETTTDAAPRLRLAGRDLAPVAASADRLTFLLPAGTAEVALVSRHGAPTDITPWCNDHRRLGLAVTAITLRGPAGEQRIALDGPAFGPGWHKLEQADGSAWRWTDGRGVLRLPETTGRTVLDLRLGSAMTYRLDPPARDRHAA